MEVDRAGWFKCKLLEYGLDEADSGAVAVAYQAILTEMWDADTQAWVPWEQYDMTAAGAVWIIKKNDAGVNEKGVNSLIQCCGWDGTLASIVNKTFEGTPFQGEVKSHVYKDKQEFRIEWLAPINAVPGKGTVSTVDDSKLRSLEAKYGAPLRALAGNAVRNKPAATARPAAPPPPVGAGKGNGDGIPF